MDQFSTFVFIVWANFSYFELLFSHPITNSPHLLTTCHIKFVIKIF